MLYSGDSFGFGRKYLHRYKGKREVEGNTNKSMQVLSTGLYQEVLELWQKRGAFEKSLSF